MSSLCRFSFYLFTRWPLQWWSYPTITRSCHLMGNFILILHASTNFSMPSFPQHAMLLFHIGISNIIVRTKVWICSLENKTINNKAMFQAISMLTFNWKVFRDFSKVLFQFLAFSCLIWLLCDQAFLVALTNKLDNFTINQSIQK